MDTIDILTLIRDAEPGATLRLPAGEHGLTGQLRVEKPLTLVGAGKSRTTLVGRHGEAVLHAASQGEVVVRRMTVAWEGEGLGDVVRCSAGRLVCDGCQLIGARVGGNTGGLAVRVSEDGHVELNGGCVGDPAVLIWKGGALKKEMMVFLAVQVDPANPDLYTRDRCFETQDTLIDQDDTAFRAYPGAIAAVLENG